MTDSPLADEGEMPRSRDASAGDNCGAPSGRWREGEAKVAALPLCACSAATLPRMRYSASLHLRNMTHISHVGRILLRHTLFHEYQMLEMLESRSTGQPAAVTEDGVFAMPVAAPAGEFTDAQIRRPDRDLPHGGRTPPSMLIKGAESS